MHGTDFECITFTTIVTSQLLRSKPPCREWARADIALSVYPGCGSAAGIVFACSTFDPLDSDFEKQREKWKEQKAACTSLSKHRSVSIVWHYAGIELAIGSR